MSGWQIAAILMTAWLVVGFTLAIPVGKILRTLTR